LDETEPGEERKAVTRKPLAPHTPLLPPPSNEYDLETFETERTAAEISQEYIDQGQIVIHEDEYVGAIQGPNYHSTGLFAPIQHKGHDINRRVLRYFRAGQEERYTTNEIVLPRLPEPTESSDLVQHENNVTDDPPAPEVLALEAPDADLDFDIENDFQLQLGPKIDDDETLAGRF
jgi:hypothetical protein